MKFSHDETLNILRTRGFDTEWAEDISYLRENSVPTHEALNELEVHGQVYDGLFENSTQLDFTELTTLSPLVGRMMYYMLRLYGTQYTKKDLLEDLDTLAERYHADFNKTEARENLS